MGRHNPPINIKALYQTEFREQIIVISKFKTSFENITLGFQNIFKTCLNSQWYPNPCFF